MELQYLRDTDKREIDFVMTEDNKIKLISTPISYWLPYINIVSIDITTNEDDPNMNHDVKISITYAIDNFSTSTITVLASQSNVTVE